MKSASRIVVVRQETRLQGLRERWATSGAAKFRLRQAREHQAAQAPQAARARRKGEAAPTTSAGAPSAQREAEFALYEREDQAYQTAARGLLDALQALDTPTQVIERAAVPTFNFAGCAAVVTLGRDGLVANVAKYVGDIPIVAVNPDPERIDGVLLPFAVGQARGAVEQAVAGRARAREVSLAEAVLNDGQRLLAFNDFFVGAQSHVSARYTLTVGGQSEPQSSSGVLVATGAGSTGWLSSVFNMTQGVARWLGGRVEPPPRLTWEDERLVWIVREPFVSKYSRADLVAGVLDDGETLVLESLMPSGGVVFSDGVERDFLEFTSGQIVTIRRAERKARLVAAD